MKITVRPAFQVIEGDEEGQWVTINGVHILIKDGETAADAFKRTTGKDLADNPKNTALGRTVHPKDYASKTADTLSDLPEDKRPSSTLVYNRSIHQSEPELVNVKIDSLQQGHKGNTVVQLVNTPDAGSAKQFTEAIDNISQQEMEKVGTIRLVKQINEQTSVQGVYRADLKEVTIFDNAGKYGAGLDKTVYHEVAHATYKSTSDSFKSEWKTVWEPAAVETGRGGVDLPNDYAATSPEEGFTECVAYAKKYRGNFVSNGNYKSSLPQMKPEVYSFLKKSGYVP